jgi:hypothetical protein
VEAENDSKLVENACFSTSYHSCSKEQVIDLSALGSASTSGYFWPFWLFSMRLAMWPWPGHLREFVNFF